MIKTKFKSFLNKIEEDNKAFDSADAAQKRVKIAQDVIDRLKVKQVIATSEFLNNEEGCDFWLESDESYKDTVNTKVCRACAKGALFLSYVGRVNNLNGTGNGSSINYDSPEMEKLKEIFTQEQLDLMELAFERNEFSWMVTDFDEEVKERAYAFNRRRNNKDNMLKAICENIIENNGTFIP